MGMRLNLNPRKSLQSFQLLIVPPQTKAQSANLHHFLALLGASDCYAISRPPFLRSFCPGCEASCGSPARWTSLAPTPRRFERFDSADRFQRSMACRASYQDSRALNQAFSATVNGRRLSLASITYVHERPSQAAGSPYLPFTIRGKSTTACSSRVRVPFRTLHFTQMVAKFDSACSPPFENA